MIVRNRKGQNPTKLCDVSGCAASVPTMVQMALANVSNPALLNWSSFWTNAKQIDFCPEHSPVIIDLLSGHANLCPDAVKRLAVMVRGPREDLKTEMGKAFRLATGGDL